MCQQKPLAALWHLGEAGINFGGYIQTVHAFYKKRICFCDYESRVYSLSKGRELFIRSDRETSISQSDEWVALGKASL